VGERYSAPVQTGPHSLLYNGYRDSFLGGKWQECGIDHSSPCSAEVDIHKVKKKSRGIPIFPSGPSWSVLE